MPRRGSKICEVINYMLKIAYEKVGSRLGMRIVEQPDSWRDKGRLFRSKLTPIEIWSVANPAIYRSDEVNITFIYVRGFDRSADNNLVSRGSLSFKYITQINQTILEFNNKGGYLGGQI